MIARMKDTSKYFAIKAVNKSFIQKVLFPSSLLISGRICEGSYGRKKCTGSYEPSLYRPYGVFIPGKNDGMS